MTELVPNLWTFVGLTLVIGGAAAFVSGRAVARGWRSPLQAVFYAAPLAGAVRFLHYALFEETTDLAQALLAFALACGFALAGYRHARRGQMARQYPWLGRDRPDETTMR